MITKESAVAVVKLNFRAAAEKFETNQTAENWLALENAMWHLQRVKQMSEAQVADLLASSAPTEWPTVFNSLNNRK